jgi:hypothetical protein
VDQNYLVEDRIEDGLKLVQKLIADGFEVKAAFWMLPGEEGSEWTLYIVSPAYDAEGPAKAYRAVYEALRSVTDPWVAMSDVKVIGLHNPIARDAMEILRRYPAKMPLHFRTRQLGQVNIEGLYIYPAPVRVGG